MSTIASKSLGFVLRQLKNAANSSDTIRKLRYDMANTGQFSDLFQHEQMIADAVRVDTYRQAIRRYVKPDDVVLDLGTGTGILSLLAAAQKPRRVYALDHSKFIAFTSPPSARKPRPITGHEDRHDHRLVGASSSREDLR